MLLNTTPFTYVAYEMLLEIAELRELLPAHLAGVVFLTRVRHNVLFQIIAL